MSQNDQNLKIFFAKGYTSNWSEDVFMIKKVNKFFTLDVFNRITLRWRNCWNVLNKIIAKDKSNRVWYAINK